MQTNWPPFLPLFSGRLAAAVIALGLSLSSAHAANGTWNLTSGGTWTIAGNWSGAIPGNNSAGVTPTTDVATFNMTAGGTVTTYSGLTVGGITFGPTAGNYNVSGSTLNLSSGGLISATGSFSEIVSAPLVVYGTNATGTINSSLTGTSTMRISGGISGGSTATGNTVLTLTGTSIGTSAAGGSNFVTGVVSDGTNTTLSILINGSGAWGLSNSGNTFSGGVTVASGTLVLNNNALGTGRLTLNTGAALNNLTGGTLVLTGTNVQTWNGNYSFQGTNSMTFGAGAITLGANTVVTVTANTLTENGAIGGAFTLGKAGAGTLVLNGNNSYSGLTTVTAGALTLAGTNTGAGGVTLTAGTLNINNASALGTGALTVTAGTLNNTSGAAITLSTNNAINVNGNFTFTGANALNLGTGAVTLGGTTIMATVNGSGPLTLGGNISGTGDSLVKAGSGTLILNGVNSYTGGTTIQGGVLSFGSATSIAGSGANVADNYTATAAFQYAFTQTDLGRLVAGSRGTVALSADNSNNLDFSAAGLGNLSLGASGGTFTYSGTLTPAGTTYRLGGGGGTLTFNQAISSGNLLVGGSGSGGTVTLVSEDTSSGGVTVTGGYGTTNIGANGASLLQTNIITSSTPFGAAGTSILLANGALGLGTAGAGLGSSDYMGVSGYNVTFSGEGSILLKSGGALSTVMFSANSLARANNGILLIDPTSGGASGTLGSTEFVYVNTGAPTVTNGMVAPYYIDGTTQTFLTYDSSFGFLDATTTGTFTGANSASIVSLGSNGNFSGYGNSVVNAVKFTNTNTSNSVTFGGSGDVLTLASGGIIFSSTSQGINYSSGIINFGSNEALVGMFGSTFSPSGATLGTGGLTTYGTGSQNWSASNITGGITIAGGQLNLQSGNGAYTFLTSNSLTVDRGGTLGFGSNARLAQFVSLAGDGTVSDYISGFNGANTFTIDGFTGTGTTNFSGIIQDFSSSGYTLSVTKYGSTTQVLSGFNNYAGTTTVNGGTLRLDFSGANAPANNIINNVSNGSGLNLGGGTLAVIGAASGSNSQQFNGLALTAGNSAISVTATGGGTVPTVTLGNVTVSGTGNFTGRSVGSTLDIVDAGATTAFGDVSLNGVGNTTNGIWTNSSSSMTAFATVNGTDWAVVSGGKIVKIASYNADAFGTASNNVDVTGNDSPTTFSVNSLRFNTAGGSVALTGNNTIGTGGILVTSNTAATGATISGGTLQSGVGKEMVIIDNGQLTVSSVIADSAGGASALTLSGSGTTTLLGANTFTGNAYVNSGTVIVGNAASFGTTAGTLVLNGGTLDSNGAVTLNAKAISLNNNSTIGGSNNLTFTGTFSNNNHSNILTVNNTGNTTLAGTVVLTNAFSGGTFSNNLMVAGSGNVTISGTVVNGAEAASLTYAGTGILSLANATNTYTGPTRVSSGTLSVTTLANGGVASSIGSSTNSASSLVISGGTFQYTGGTASTDHLFSIGANGGTIDASGSGAVTFSNTGAIGFDSAPVTRTLTLTGTNTGNNTLASSVTDYLGLYATSVSKTGVGTWTLTGTNTYTGGTTVSAGKLLVSNTTGSATGAGAFQLNSGATLSGNGIISGTINTINGTVLAGFDTGATNTTGNLTLKSSGTTTFSGPGMNLAFNLSTTPGTGTELNVGNSAVAFGTGMTLTLNLMGSTSATGNDYILFAGTGTSQYSGLVTSGGHITNFNIVLTGTTLGQNNSDLYAGSYLYLNGSNIDVVLAVPEPGTWAMMLGGLALLVVYQRRRSLKRMDA